MAASGLRLWIVVLLLGLLGWQSLAAAAALPCALAGAARASAAMADERPCHRHRPALAAAAQPPPAAAYRHGCDGFCAAHHCAPVTLALPAQARLPLAAAATVAPASTPVLDRGRDVVDELMRPPRSS